MSQTFPGPVGNMLYPVHSLSSIHGLGLGLGLGFFCGSRIENQALYMLDRCSIVEPQPRRFLTLFLVISVSFP